MKHSPLSVCLLAALLLFTGCSSPADEPNAAAAYAPPEQQRLTVYTSHKKEVYWPIITEFEERTGVWVDVVAGGSGELLSRIAAESDAPRADVMFGGGVDSLGAYGDCFSPYFCTDWELLRPELRAADGLWTPFSALPVVLIYNTSLVRPGQLIAWRDLPAPAWQGRIAFADPMVSGSSYTALVTLLHVWGGETERAMRELAVSLDGRQLAGSGEVLDSVADGTDLVGITLEETALQRIEAGDDIALVYPADGTSCIPDGAALVSGAPHEENARLFLDFIAGRDVQRLLAERLSRRPVRTDVETAKTLPALESLPLTDYDIRRAGREHDAVLMSWAFYLGGEEIP